MTSVKDSGASPAAGPTGVLSTRWRRALPIIGWGAVFAFIVAMLATFGLEAALHFNGPPIDGPFQLYNALRRIMAGQRGGVDFQFFHGIGLPYLAYLPFRLMGGTFTASELARQLIATLSGPLVILALFRAFTGGWERAFKLSIIVLALSVALGQWPMVLAVNSLLGLRSAVPTLTPVIWVLQMPPRRKAVLMGAAIGISILLGTEQGLAILAAFVVVAAVGIWRSTERHARTTEALLTVVVAALTIATLVGGIGGWAGVTGALHYNLKLIPMDQYWYFGAPPNVFLTGWGSLGRRMMDQPMIPTTLVLGVVAAAIHLRRQWRAGPSNESHRSAATGMLILYGLVACASLLGIFLVTYVEPCIRALLIIGALELDSRQQMRERSGATTSWWDRRLSIGTAATAGLLLMATCTPERSSVRTFPSTILRSFVTEFPDVIVNHGLHHEGMTFGHLWPKTIATGQGVLDAHRQVNGQPPTLWSTYAGLLEARNGMFQPSVDYIIHVLGPDNRARYVEEFRRQRPTLVQTVRPTYSQYELWIEQTSWDFYAELLRNYRAIDATPWSIFWERLPAPQDGPKDFLASPVAPGSRSIDVPLPVSATSQSDAMLVQIELTYRVHNPLGAVPVIGPMPRYLVTVSGALTVAPVTLDPYTTTSRFPIVAVQGQRLRLGFAAYSLLPGASIEVTSVRASQIAITRANYPWLYDLALSVAPGRVSPGR